MISLMHRRRRSTPPGQHRPVLLDEVLAVLAPREGAVVVDCTAGWAGHAAELLRRVGPAGRLIALDADADNLAHAKARLEQVGHPFSVHHANFAALANVLAAEGVAHVDAVLADLGMSSMQVDDPQRGFSYVREGPLDMRMDRSRGRTAAELLAGIAPAELAQALREYGDEPAADRLAPVIVRAAKSGALQTTAQLTALIQQTLGQGPWRLHPRKDRWNLHPAARTFQALRILVNRELASLQHLLRLLPDVLAPGGKAAIISFHSGEDRLVKAAFRDGARSGAYSEVSAEPVRATSAERLANPRSRSAKLRWGVRAAHTKTPPPWAGA
jgi:16S rRNA (cytosine1402-N4)-methyltransferase